MKGKENYNRILPVTNYLNQKIVFDLLAVIEDGFSQVKNLSVTNDEGNTVKKSADTSFATGKGLDLFGLSIKFGGALSKDTSRNQQQETVEERVHTPTSLFSKLMYYLDTNDQVIDIENAEQITELVPGQFVRYSCLLEENPLISMLNSFEQLGKLIEIFGQEVNKQNNNKPNNNNNKNRGNKHQQEKQDHSMKILEEIAKFKNSLTQQGTMVDMVCTINDHDNLKAVIPVYYDMFFNRNMSELIDGHFTVVGKVVKVVTEKNYINLYRNTGFKLFKQDTLEDLFKGINQLMEGNGNEEEFELSVPDMKSKIQEPALLVIPIAIYT